jgi:hypothetical protein
MHPEPFTAPIILPAWLIAMAIEDHMDPLIRAHHLLFTLEAWQLGD